MTIKISISTGELIDKITILEIKTQFVTDMSKLNIINNELVLLNKEYSKLLEDSDKKSKKIISYKEDLYEVNFKLWEIEDKIRVLESKKEFNDEFVKLARNVYFYNDKRSELKNKINVLTDSNISEVKQYPDYRNKDE